jgi:hypothetical protein
MKPPAIGAATRRVGIDVTFPFPSFHSAIRQPNLSNFAPEAVDELNDFGLFATLEAAQDVAHRGNQTDTSWRPFCPVTIWVVEPEESIAEAVR